MKSIISARKPAGMILVGFLVALAFWAGPHVPVLSSDKNDLPKLPEGVPAKVARVLKQIDDHDKPPKGYVGGRTFENRERRLPRKDAQGKLITYREWDVNPKVRGKDRGPERLATGSDGSAYYTADHYKHFKKIR